MYVKRGLKYSKDLNSLTNAREWCAVSIEVVYGDSLKDEDGSR